MEVGLHVGRGGLRHRGNAPVPSLALILYIQESAHEPSIAIASLPVSSIWVLLMPSACIAVPAGLTLCTSTRSAISGSLLWRPADPAQQAGVRVDPVATVGLNHRMDGQRPVRPIDAPAFNILRVKAAVVGMIAIHILREGSRHFHEMIPRPRLFRIIAGRFDPLCFEDIGIVVDVGSDPAGADAVPFALRRATTFLLRLDEVVRRAEQRVGL